MVFAINTVNANVNNAANVNVNVAVMAVRGCADIVTAIIAKCSKPQGKGKRLLQERRDHRFIECHHAHLWHMGQSLFAQLGNFLQGSGIDSLRLMPARVMTTRHTSLTTGSSTQQGYRTSINSSDYSSNLQSFSNY